MRRFWEEWAGTFEDLRIEVESVVDLGGGVVYAPTAGRVGSPKQFHAQSLGFCLSNAGARHAPARQESTPPDLALP